MHRLKFLSTFLLLLSALASLSVAQRSSFGESCDDTLKCDKRAWLTCRNGTCDCMKPDVMMFEDSLGKCASKSGERCKFVFEAFDGKNIYEVMDCVENSNCTSDGFCACDNKYYENLNGTCTRSSSHMETCDSVVKCSKYEALQCFDGLCKCNETVSTFNSKGASSDRQCVGLAGESCINSKCIENAACSSGNVCTCDDDYYQDDEKKCVQKISPFGNCTKNEHCMNFKGTQLICQNGACNCNPQVSRYGTAQKSRVELTNHYDRYYGRTTQQRSVKHEGAQLTQCLGLSASPCLDSLCVSNGYCESGTCKCSDGYTTSKYGNCAHNYGESCTAAVDCIDGLMCKQRTCKCPFNDQEYDSSKKTCISKVDGPCNSSTPCMINAECVLFSKSPVEAGHCSCKTGFIKTLEGKCTTAFGQPCSSGSDCDSVAALVCTNEICQCDDFGKYSEKYRKCLGLVGAKCDLRASWDSREPQCVENSKCESVHPRLHGICTCAAGSGFTETPQYTCEVENGVTKKVPIHDEEKRKITVELITTTTTTTSTESPALPMLFDSDAEDDMILSSEDYEENPRWGK